MELTVKAHIRCLTWLVRDDEEDDVFILTLTSWDMTWRVWHRESAGCYWCYYFVWTGTSGHVHANECSVGVCLDVFPSVSVYLSAFMHTMWMHVYVRRWPLVLRRPVLLSNLRRALGEVRMSTSLCLPFLTHTIRPEWISFADNDRWTAGYPQVWSRQINIVEKNV